MIEEQTMKVVLVKTEKQWFSSTQATPIELCL